MTKWVFPSLTEGFRLSRAFTREEYGVDHKDAKCAISQIRLRIYDYYGWLGRHTSGSSSSSAAEHVAELAPSST